MYKKSKYILEIENYDGDYIAYNITNGKYFNVSKENKERFKDILSFSDKYIKTTVFQTLAQYGFIIHEKHNEHREMDFRYSNTCRSDKKFKIIIMPTEKCNFNCIYCYQNHKKGAMTIETQNALVSAVAKKIKTYNSLHVEWFGGEPLLEIGMIESLSLKFQEICAEQKKSYVASMTTNGYYLDYNTFKKMRKCNVSSFQVTLDGLEEYHDSNRTLFDGTGTFNKIISNLDEIKEKDISSFWKISIRTNYTKENIMQKEKWEKYIDDNFLCDKRFEYIPKYAFETTNNEDISHLLFTDAIINDVSVLDEIAKIDETKIHRELKSRSKDVEFTGKVKAELDKMIFGGMICYAGTNSSIIIGADGTLYKCTILLYENENIVGKLDSKSKDFIYYHQKYLYWISPGLNDNEQLECSNCILYPICLSISCPKETRPENKNRKLFCKYLYQWIYNHILALSYEPKNEELNLE